MNQHLMEVVLTKTTFSSSQMDPHMDHFVIRGQMGSIGVKKKIKQTDTGGHIMKDLELSSQIILIHLRKLQQPNGQRLPEELQQDEQLLDQQLLDEQLLDEQLLDQHKHQPRNQ